VVDDVGNLVGKLGGIVLARLGLLDTLLLLGRLALGFFLFLLLFLFGLLLFLVLGLLLVLGSLLGLLFLQLLELGPLLVDGGGAHARRRGDIGRLDRRFRRGDRRWFRLRLRGRLGLGLGLRNRRGSRRFRRRRFGFRGRLWHRIGFGLR